jgi:subtilisin family serine protease
MPKLIKPLDPRLRRLVSCLSDPDRLRRDERDGVIATTVEPSLLADTGAAIDPGEFTKQVLVQVAEGKAPASFSDLEWRALAGNIYAVTVPITRLEELALQKEVLYVEGGRKLYAHLNASVVETKANAVHQGTAAQPGLRGAGVLVGIIDLGFDYTLDDFRNADGSTRVEFLWDQALTAVAGEQSPAGFSLGVEYTRADINAALALPNPFLKVRHKPGQGSHGTHVAGIAAGNGRSTGSGFLAGQFIGAAPEATIIFVQPALESGVGTFTDSVRAAQAVTYIFEKARQLDLPCVINMSLGQNGGSHDGESLLERTIDSLLTTPGRAFVVAAGNEHLWRGHASGTIATGASATLRWATGGGMPLPAGNSTAAGVDQTANELEVWYSSRDVFEVRLLDPSGNATQFVTPGNTETFLLPSGNQVFIDSERFSRLNGDARIYFEVSRGSAAPIQSGVWKVEIRSVESRNGRFDAWIERDRRSPASGFADQSFFVGTDFDAQRTLGTPATGRYSIAVANYDHVTQEVSASSSRGATRDGRNKPEVAAPGTNILSSGALGNRPNPAIPTAVFPVRVRQSGTSMAAPHVAGIIALLFQQRRGLTSEQIRKVLIASASPPPGVAVFDINWGYGRVDAAAALELVTRWIN